MNSSIEILYLTAKLPGYLYILANLTNVGDTVGFNCPESQTAYVSAMLAKLGLSAQANSFFQKGQLPKGIVLRVFDRLNASEEREDNYISILQFPYQFPLQQFKQCAEDILFRNPDYFIVDELQDLADCKSFAIAFLRGYHNSELLKQKIMRN